MKAPSRGNREGGEGEAGIDVCVCEREKVQHWGECVLFSVHSGLRGAVVFTPGA